MAIRLNNFASVLQAANRLAEAEPLMRRALRIDEASYGADNPNVARDLNNLARLLQATNRLAEAEPLVRRALAICERSLGPDHPRTATVRRNLAALEAAVRQRKASSATSSAGAEPAGRFFRVIARSPKGDVAIQGRPAVGPSVVSQARCDRGLRP